METKNRSHKITNKNTTYENNGPVINGDVTLVCNNYINSEDTYEVLTEKDNYTDFYKSYIAKFEELEGYAFSLFYPYFNEKNFNFKSNTLVFGKKIIDWVYGLAEFPNQEIQTFYNSLKRDFNFNDNTVVVKRWDANIDYFKGDIKLASENYDRLYDELIKCKAIPKWYLDDICIDGRNLSYQYNSTQNKYFLDNKFQKKLSSNKHKLSYPDVDRIKAEIFENVSKHIFDNKNKSKFTTIYGIGLESCFAQIQNLIFLTIFYGSITHLKLIRELISNIMYMYADTFEDEEFYNLTLKMLFLSGDFKKYRNLYNKIKLNYSFVININFIQSIVESRKSLFDFELASHNIFLFEIYGRYMDDELFKILTETLFDIVTIDNNYQTNIISDAFKAIATNIKRVGNIGKLLKIIKEYLNKSYLRFYTDFGRILGEIDVDGLTEEEFQDYQSIIDLLMSNQKHINYDLSNFIVEIKKRDPKITKYDELIAKQGTNENIVYQIEMKKDELEVVKNIVNIYKTRHVEREKNPSVFTGYMTEYNIGNSLFTDELYKENVRNFMLNEYLPLAKSIILSKNETIYEKIRHIKLLSYLLMVEKDESIRKEILSIVHKAKKIKCLEGHSFGIIKSRNEKDLDINIMMCEGVAQIVKYDEILCRYLEFVIKDAINIEEMLDCILILNDFYNDKDEIIIDKLFLLFQICYQINDIDVRNSIIIMSQIFLGTKYQEEIIKILEERVNNMIFEECKGYIQLIMNVPKEDKGLYDSIILKLKNSNNYYIKYMVNKYV